MAEVLNEGCKCSQLQKSCVGKTSSEWKTKERFHRKHVGYSWRESWEEIDPVT